MSDEVESACYLDVRNTREVAPESTTAESRDKCGICFDDGTIPDDVDETNLSLDARDELRDDRDDDRPVASWRALDYQEPVSHGHGIMAVLQDLDTDGETAYKRLWSAWRDYVGGSSKFYQGSHVKEVVTSDSWDRAGFIGDYARRDGYNLGLKVYRIAGNPSDERLKHPKLEAFLEGTDGEELPHIDEWDSIRATLRQMTSGLAIRSGVSLGDLREDDFYTVDPDDRVDTLVPTGWRKANRLANQERERRILRTTYEALSLAKWDVLYSVAMLDGATYDQLQEFTGFSRDYIREVVRELKENDILMRLTYPRVVVYQNQELRLNAVEKL